jgi:tetratricopeptide (TPR) repeat protein
MRDAAGRERILRHVDQALADAGGDLATVARLQAIKGQQWADEALLASAVAYAKDSGNPLAQSFATLRYGQYLGIRCHFERSLDHIARTIDILGAQREKIQQAQMMAGVGRCFYARAGKLDQALRYAARARDVADASLDVRLRAWCAAEAEPYMYKGLWNEVVRVAEERLPLAWEIRDWTLILFVSAWLAVAYLKLGRSADARRVLDRMFKEVPARTLGFEIYAAAYRQIVLAQLHLAENSPGEALSAVREAARISQRAGAPLEEGAAHRVLGQVYDAMGARADAHNAFRDSLEVLEKIQCPPELAQTLLAYGRFRRGDNALEDRAMIERALALFEEMNAPGWIEEARAALASPSPKSRGTRIGSSS